MIFRRPSQFFLLLFATLLIGCDRDVKFIESADFDLNRIAVKTKLEGRVLDFQEFDVNDGLPQNSASDIVHDSLGYTWCLTQRGWGRFENNSFVAYRHRKDDPTSILESSVRHSRSDLDKEFRLAGNRGVSTFDPVRKEFNNWRNPDFIDTLKQKALISDGHFLYTVKTDSSLKITHHGDSTQNNWEVSLKEGSWKQIQEVNGRVLGLRLTEDSLVQLVEFPFGNAEESFTPILTSSEKVKDGSNDQFIKGNSDILLFEDQFYLISDDLVSSTSFQLDEDVRISSIEVCDQSQGGQYVVINSSDSILIYETDKKFSDGKKKFSVEHDGSNILAAVNSLGDITIARSDVFLEILHFNGSDKSPQRFKTNLKLAVKKFAIRKMIYDHADNLWVGTTNKKVYVHIPDAQKIIRRDFHIIDVSQENFIFTIFTEGSSVYHLSRKGVIVCPQTNERYSLGEEVKKNTTILSSSRVGDSLVFGAGDAGILIFDTKTKKYEQLIVPGRDKTRMRIRYAFFDSKGRLWCYGNKMIARMLRDESGNLDPSSTSYYRNENGRNKLLLTNRMETLIELKGEIYAGAQAGGGIVKFNEETEEFDQRMVGLDEQLGEQITWKHPAQGRNGLWFPSFSSGLMHVDSSLQIKQVYSATHSNLNLDWISSFAYIDEEHIMYRGESDDWFMLNPLEGTYEVIHGYKEDGWSTRSFHVTFLNDSTVNLPGRGAVYHYSLKDFSNPKRCDLRINDLHINDVHYSEFTETPIEVTNRIELNADQNNLVFGLADLMPQNPNVIQYEYRMSGFEDRWRLAEESMTVNYPGMPHGEYLLQFRMRIKGKEDFSDIYELQLFIRPPWYQTIFAYIVYVLMFLVFIFFVVRLRTKQLMIRQLKLEEIIEEKTEDIRVQKEQIEEKQHEILDSIAYAKRIQSAILPPQKLVKEHLKDSFILYKPKDFVAGDFYWMGQKGNRILFAAADCTGHGVPGAMVSVICNNGLNRSLNEFDLTDPGQILDKTRELVIKEFEKSEEEVKDGMDIALCALEGKTIHFSGAHNPLWIIRKGATEVEQIKADKQPIGQYAKEEPFNTKKIDLAEGDTIYIFSDGYVDQFGGENLPVSKAGGKKFKAAQLRRLLLSIQSETMDRQKELLDQAFINWMGSFEQVDDVCMIGVRL